jgi:hypothetical protein
MIRRGVKVGTCSLLFLRHIGSRFNSRHMFFTLFDPDIVRVASNCTYIK